MLFLSVRGFTYHVARRTFASITDRSAKFSAAERRLFFGHGNRTITDHYTHAMWDHMVEAATDYLSQFGWGGHTSESPASGQWVTPQQGQWASPKSLQ